MKYVCALITVDNMAVSRRFYEELLGQTVEFDFGENVAFKGFSLHLKPHFESLLGEPGKFPAQKRSNNMELYFETDEVLEFSEKLKQAGVEFIHEVKEQPWGQRVMRFYDPDSHIIEIGETMEGLVVRLHNNGLSLEEIAAKTYMPREFIENALAQK